MCSKIHNLYPRNAFQLYFEVQGHGNGYLFRTDYECSASLFGSQDGLGFQKFYGFTDGRAADLEHGTKLGLRWNAVAGHQVSGVDLVSDIINDFFHGGRLRIRIARFGCSHMKTTSAII